MSQFFISITKIPEDAFIKGLHFVDDKIVGCYILLNHNHERIEHQQVVDLNINVLFLVLFDIFRYFAVGKKDK